jgi:hypothetical protein
MEARRSIDVHRIAYELQQIGPQAREPWAAGSSMARTAEALESQMATARRMDETLADAEARLRLLDARLDESVTRAIELSVQAHDLNDLAGLEGEVDSVVSDMEALRLALRETEGEPLPSSLPPPPTPHPQQGTPGSAPS